MDKSAYVDIKPLSMECKNNLSIQTTPDTVLIEHNGAIPKRKCICGSIVSVVNTQHIHSEKHRSYLRSICTPEDDIPSISHTYEHRRDKILEYSRTRIKCECGAEIGRSFITQHRATKKHFDLLANISD
jgi:hypothetical protein